MIKLFAVLGVGMLLLMALLCIGKFIDWIVDDDLYTAWFVTCMAFATTLALIIVSALTTA